MSWTSGVLRMLDRLKEQHVILFLEDFMIKKEVETRAVEHLIHIARHTGAGRTGLAPLPAPTPLPNAHHPEFPEVGPVDPGSPYRVSTQAAIWRTTTLRRLLIPGLSAWEFEHIGSQLSETMPDEFLSPFAPSVLYDHAVEKGKWKPEGLRICREAGIDVKLGDRAAFSKEELERHYLEQELQTFEQAFKQRTLDSFRAGNRKAGWREAKRWLRHSGVSVQALGIVVCGLLGRRPLCWLRRWHVGIKVVKARMRYYSDVRRSRLLLERGCGQVPKPPSVP
jgi:hypothetical protein